MIRIETKKQQKGPVQLDLFEPYGYGYEFKVIVTNKALTAAAVVDYHGGRRSQEIIFGELETDCQMEYVPVRKRLGSETYLLASSFAFHSIRDLQIQQEPPARVTPRKRSALWQFEHVGTFRQTVLQPVGRLTKPSGKRVLTFCVGKHLKQRVLQVSRSFAACNLGKVGV